MKEKRIVIVTGAGQGIGKAVAKEFAEHGDYVILCDVNKEQIEALAKEIHYNGGHGDAVLCDVSKPEQIETMISYVNETYGRIDVVINNAGISRWKSLFDITVEEWDKVIHTNLRSVFLCTREAAKIMRNNGGGAVINLASTRATMSEPNSEAYAASKGGVVALTHALAASLQNEGIRVNAISPGWIHTGDENELRSIDHEQHFSKRVGVPSDIARACLFLADEKNDFINGENLVIDGGMTRKMIYEE
ncbi:glucose 1-dehydrogenase [Halalkalibacterium ligniniphilum]|uniref:glucose 1-dehydrogenase n=1 Tax=Halalkalibacterium ligniniphilum TaxID=1134413 RepID=UPI00034D8982|nr:glucose 1-dehydrogenase [Halalkalibacterium ligniniphilum]